MADHNPRKRKCRVIDGCEALVSNTTFYRHRDTESCRKEQVQEHDQQRIAAQRARQMSHDRLKPLRLIFVAGFLFLQKIHCLPNTATTAIIRFSTAFLHLVGRFLKVRALIDLARMIPRSYDSYRKILDIDDMDFVQYAVCPKCHSIYPKDDVVSRRISKCTFRKWPDHPQVRRRRPCNAQLHRGRSRIPKRVYCFRSISTYLKHFVNQPDFIARCNAWRQRTLRENYIADIYDGTLWKSEMDGYLSSPHNLYVMVNVDWFNPYKYSEYSLGAIYLVILNLPRSERFKEENVLLVGVIPGPTEPKLNLNSYLQPLVADLHLLDEGVHFHDATPLGNYYRLRLFGCSSDLPATRKLGGFLSYHAKYGCSKCLKTFPRLTLNNGKMKGNFSGFDRASWQPRDGRDHKLGAHRTKSAKSEAERKRMEATGTRWSALFALQYHNPVIHHTVDAMHCLFLGLAKTMSKHYVKSGLLDKAGLAKIQSTINQIRVPATVGRIPRKIQSGFSSMTSDELKSWVLIYSSVALKSVLDEKHYKVWMKFVHANSLIVRKVLNVNDLMTADALLLSFCSDVQELYGEAFVTPNFHMACHLVQVIKEYGPVYTFWCYSFERYNGMLGAFTVNNHNISTQMMRKFLMGHQLSELTLPDITSETILNLIRVKEQRGTLSSVGNDITDHARTALTEDIRFCAVSVTSEDRAAMCTGLKQQFLCDTDYERLTDLYSLLYPDDEMPTLHRNIEEIKTVVYNNELFRADNSDKINCNIIRARWLCAGYRNVIDGSEKVARAGAIKRIIATNHTSEGVQQSLLLLEVQWFSWHEQVYALGQHVQVYHKSISPPGVHSFIPIQRVMSKCALQVYRLDDINVHLVIPLLGQWAL